MNLCSSIIDLLRGKKVIALVFAIQQAGAQNHLPILEKLAEADPAPFVIVEGSGKDTKKKLSPPLLRSKMRIQSPSAKSKSLAVKINPPGCHEATVIG